MHQPDESRKPPPKSTSRDVRRVDSETLLQGKTQLIIRHAGEDYRLILTRNNRLILQK